ncbi:hypothetical protein TNCV_3679221 [Trichonephila clavipes]|nr:hypothetical protein TNCV_3679221 [Trichonephila clavipes]
MSPSQYSGYDPRLKPSGLGFESQVRHGCIFFGKEVALSPEMDSRLQRKSSAPSSTCYMLGSSFAINLYSSMVVLYVSVHLSHVFRMYPSNKHTTTTVQGIEKLIVPLVETERCKNTNFLFLLNYYKQHEQ